MKKVKQMLNKTTKQIILSGGKSQKLASKSGVPGEIRTHDPLLRRQLLCPTELQGHVISAD